MDLSSNNLSDQIPRFLQTLSFLERLTIALDVASALDYLHNHCQTPIIHCDLKPSNVLLDDNMTAHVGDFGLATILSEITNKASHHTSSAVIKGTIGYVAPEYGVDGKVSTYGDVYSYGILLLELFTGRRPTDEMFRDGLITLHEFVKMDFPDRVMKIMDPKLLLEEENINQIDNDENWNRLEECLVSIVRVGLLCTVESPRARINMRDVVKEMQVITDQASSSE